MSKIEVSHYGIHWDPEKVAWLEQGRGGVNAFGLSAKSPFLVRPMAGSRHCNHQISLSNPIPNDRHWEVFMKLQSDPLVRALMPFPKPDSGIYYLIDETRLTDYLVMLSRMSSPIYPIVSPFWTVDRPSLVKLLGESNVQPLVLTGAQTTDIGMIREIAPAAAHRPRRLVMSGIAEIVLPTTVRKIETKITQEDFNELNSLPWEVLGAVAIKKYMRREWKEENTSNARPEYPARPTDRSERTGT